MNCKTEYYQIIASHPKMMKVLDTLVKFAHTDLNCVIYGEIGTGKKLIAHKLHSISKRSAYPFIPFFCGAKSEDKFHEEMLECFKQANRGTVFLDEIGELSKIMQLKLLGFFLNYPTLQDKETKPISVNVRLIASTQMDLKNMVSNGKFHGGLYNRLQEVELNMPPLRDRKEDICDLVKHFITKYQTNLNKIVGLDVTKATINQLMNYHWPGNIRQLENAIRQSLLTANGRELKIEDMPKDLHDFKTESIEPEKTLKKAMEIFKKDYVMKTLAKTSGNRTQAAKILNVQRTYLSRLIKELEIDQE